MSDLHYDIKRTRIAPGASDTWDGACWSPANVLEVNQFHPRSSSHRPRTRARLLYDDDALHVLFHVQDRYVRCVHLNFQDYVSRDSCVEFFLQPEGHASYLNFEINCGGTMLLYCIEDPTRGEGAPFRKFMPLTARQASAVRLWHSLPSRVEPEITDPVEWTLGCSVPFTLFEPFFGPVQPVAGRAWRGNLFKCGDQTSHPHWASWAPIGDVLRFHQPERFAPLRFATQA